MIDLSNPLNILQNNWIDTLRVESIHAERQGKLTKKQLNIIYEQGWFKMLAPVSYGGKQLSLPEALRIEEALACVDGSVGWVVTLCAGAGWFGGFLESEIAKNIFADEHVCLAGSGAKNGTAEIVDGGYMINGAWQYASGITDATSVTANCVVTQNGIPVKDEKGNDTILAFVFLKNEVTITGHFNAFGMTATSSHSYEIKNLVVKQDRAFNIKQAPLLSASLYYYPFQQFAEATLAINMTGMCLHFMDLCGKIITSKVHTEDDHINLDLLNDKYEHLLEKLQTARQKLYYAVDMSWQVCSANKDISPSLLYKVTAGSFTAVHVVRDCVNTLFPYCGLSSANKDSEINRVWRDIQTAGQHKMLVGDGK